MVTKVPYIRLKCLMKWLFYMYTNVNRQLYYGSCIFVYFNAFTEFKVCIIMNHGICQKFPVGIKFPYIIVCVKQHYKLIFLKIYHKLK